MLGLEKFVQFRTDAWRGSTFDAPERARRHRRHRAAKFARECMSSTRLVARPRLHDHDAQPAARFRTVAQVRAAHPRRRQTIRIQLQRRTRLLPKRTRHRFRHAPHARFIDVEQINHTTILAHWNFNRQTPSRIRAHREQSNLPQQSRNPNRSRELVRVVAQLSHPKQSKNRPTRIDADDFPPTAFLTTFFFSILRSFLS